MAKDKSSFVLYTDLIHTVKKMAKAPNGKSQVGELFITILEYVNDLNPTPEDPMVEIVFEPIKQQMKRDLKKYEKTVEYKKEGAALGNLKRWYPDLHAQVIGGKLSLQEALFKSDELKASGIKGSNRICDNSIAPRHRTDARIADNDNVNVNVNVNDIDKERFATVLPFQSEEFKKQWDNWVRYRREIKKPYQTQSAIQHELQNLGKHSEKEAIEMITTAVKNEWRNIRPLELTQSSQKAATIQTRGPKKAGD